MAAMAGIGGFAAGVAQGQQTAFEQNQKQQMMDMAMQESSVRVRKEELQVKQAEMLMAANQEAAKKIKSLNEGGASPTAQPWEQADRLADIQDMYAAAYSNQGLGEQSAEASARAMQLRESAYKLHTAQTDRLVENARDYSVRVADIDPSDPNAQAKWRQLVMSHQTSQPDNPSQFSGNEPFTPQFKERLLNHFEQVKTAGMNEKDKVLADYRISKTEQAGTDMENKLLRMEMLQLQIDAKKKAGAVDTSDVHKFLGALGAEGLSLKGVSRSAAAQQEAAAGLMAQHPDMTIPQLVNYVRGEQVGLKADMAAAMRLGQRETNIATAVVELNKPGGIYDKVLRQAEEVNFSDSKVQNQTRLWFQKHIAADPSIQKYLNVLGEARATLTQALQKSGTMTEGAAERAQEMLPDPSSFEELKGAVWMSKQVLDQVAQGNDIVKSALKAGKSVSEVAELAGAEPLPKERKLPPPPPPSAPAAAKPRPGFGPISVDTGS